MIKKSWLSILLAVPGALAAQKLEVVSSAGLHSSGRAQQITATLGETFVSMVAKDDHLFTEGFQQGSIAALHSAMAMDREEPASDWRATVYPNPASERVQISFLSTRPQSYRLRLMNALGMVLMEAETADEVYSINLQDFSPGQYWITINASDPSESLVLPLTKMQL